MEDNPNSSFDKSSKFYEFHFLISVEISKNLFETSQIGIIIYITLCNTVFRPELLMLFFRCRVVSFSFFFHFHTFTKNLKKHLKIYFINSFYTLDNECNRSTVGYEFQMKLTNFIRKFYRFQIQFSNFQKLTWFVIIPLSI